MSVFSGGFIPYLSLLDFDIRNGWFSPGTFGALTSV